MWDFLSLLMDTMQAPAVMLVCGLLVFIAGIALGIAARDASGDEDLPRDAGDTHAKWAQPVETRPRLRAGRAPAAALKPSFDSRKAANPVRPAKD